MNKTEYYLQVAAECNNTLHVKLTFPEKHATLLEMATGEKVNIDTKAKTASISLYPDMDTASNFHAAVEDLDKVIAEGDKRSKYMEIADGVEDLPKAVVAMETEEAASPTSPRSRTVTDSSVSSSSSSSQSPVSDSNTSGR